MYYGVDLSSHNGKVNFEVLALEIEFAMLRIGYGKGNMDSRFAYNANKCEKYNIPFGGYWFSYALNKDMAKKEAEYCCEIISKFNPKLPIAYDWEYDSDRYARNQGKNLTAKDVANFAEIFCDTIIKHGYSTMIYSNEDYIKKCFSGVITKYPLWYAKWSGMSPERKCDMWQYSDKDTYKGIIGKVDANIYYGKINSENETIKTIDEIEKNVIDKIPTSWWYNYRDVAVDVINGKYGNGDNRKAKLKEKGFDPTIVQLIVNELVN